jgi:hypothetical protein
VLPVLGDGEEPAGSRPAPTFSHGAISWGEVRSAKSGARSAASAA